MSDNFVLSSLPDIELTAEAHAAYHWIKDIHQHAANVLAREDPDPLQLNYHLERVVEDILPCPQRAI